MFGAPELDELPGQEDLVVRVHVHQPKQNNLAVLIDKNMYIPVLYRNYLTKKRYQEKLRYSNDLADIYQIFADFIKLVL